MNLQQAIDHILRSVEGAPEELFLPKGSDAKALRIIEKDLWARIRETVCSKAGGFGATLPLTMEERLLIDGGVLDIRLLGNKAAHTLRTLTQEFGASVPTNCFYLSEWLQERLRQQFVMSEAERRGRAGQPQSERMAPLIRQRLALLSALRPVFARIPGLNPTGVDLLCSGRLDSALDQLTRRGILDPTDSRVNADRRLRLSEFRARSLELARLATRDEEQLDLLHTLECVDDEIYQVILEECAVALKRKEQGTPAEELGSMDWSPSEKSDFLSREIRLVRNLIPLGIAWTPLRRTHSVLLPHASMTTRADLRKSVEKVCECDPFLPQHLKFLILPFVGTGFYEWDRDMTILPLVPVRTMEEALVAGLANYRMVSDKNQNDHALQKAYEKSFPGIPFVAGFLDGYRRWVLEIGAGLRGSMDADHFAFFQEFVGPRPSLLFATINLWQKFRTQRERQIAFYRDRLRSSAATGFDAYCLAVLYWQEGNPRSAFDALEVAVKLAPNEGRFLVAAAHLALHLLLRKKAAAFAKAAMQLDNPSIWKSYAVDYFKKSSEG